MFSLIRACDGTSLVRQFALGKRLLFACAVMSDHFLIDVPLAIASICPFI